MLIKNPYDKFFVGPIKIEDKEKLVATKRVVKEKLV